MAALPSLTGARFTHRLLAVSVRSTGIPHGECPVHFLPLLHKAQGIWGRRSVTQSLATLVSVVGKIARATGIDNALTMWYTIVMRWH